MLSMGYIERECEGKMGIVTIISGLVGLSLLIYLFYILLAGEDKQ